MSDYYEDWEWEEIDYPGTLPKKILNKIRKIPKTKIKKMVESKFKKEAEYHEENNDNETQPEDENMDKKTTNEEKIIKEEPKIVPIEVKVDKNNDKEAQPEVKIEISKFEDKPRKKNAFQQFEDWIP